MPSASTTSHHENSTPILAHYLIDHDASAVIVRANDARALQRGELDDRRRRHRDTLAVAQRRIASALQRPEVNVLHAILSQKRERGVGILPPPECLHVILTREDLLAIA